MSSEIVVDACVLRAAGQTHSTAVSGVACREALIIILEQHEAVSTPAIREEWDNHSSRFSRRWLHQMFGRKKIRKLDTPDECVPVRASIDKLAEQDRDAATKDVHLIDAALATDNIICSCDNVAREIFAGMNCGAIAQIIWGNPVQDGNWLLQPHLRLDLRISPQ